MPRAGRALEQLVARLERELGHAGVVVKSPDHLPGKSSGTREIDVSLRARVGTSDVVIIIECRDRKPRQDVMWLEQVAAKRIEVGASKAVAVSVSGFTAAARAYAAAHDVELRTVRNLSAAELEQWLLLDHVGVFVNRVRVVQVTFTLAPSAVASTPPPMPVTATDKLIAFRSSGVAMSLNEIMTSPPLARTVASHADEPERRNVRIPFAPGDAYLTTPRGEVELAAILVGFTAHEELVRVPISSTKQYVGAGPLAETVSFNLQPAGLGGEIHMTYDPQTRQTRIGIGTASELPAVGASAPRRRRTRGPKSS